MIVCDNDLGWAERGWLPRAGPAFQLKYDHWYRRVYGDNLWITRGDLWITAWFLKREYRMTQPDTPEWYTKPPEWWSSRPADRPPASRTPGYGEGRQDAELLTAIRSMPEQVVGALREAIQAANSSASQQQASPPQQQQAPPEQKQEQQKSDAPPAPKSFADRWFDNSL